MATTIHEPPQIVKAPPGNGGWRNLVPSEGSPRAVQYAPPPSSTAIWVVLFSITMTFAAFTSALIVRQGSSLDWRHFTLPSILYGNTAVLLASSATLEMARRRVASFMGGARSQVGSPARWLYVTLGLGLLFVAGQYAAWLQLKGEGFYLATNPSSSFSTCSLPPMRCMSWGAWAGWSMSCVSSASRACDAVRWMRPRTTGISWAVFGCTCCCCFG